MNQKVDKETEKRLRDKIITNVTEGKGSGFVPMHLNM